MLGKQASIERLYPKREDGVRELKSMRGIFKETRRVACYVSKSENRWIQAAYRSKILKVENTVVTEAWATIEELDVMFKFEDNAIQLDGDRIEQEWKPKSESSASKVYKTDENRNVSV